MRAVLLALAVTLTLAAPAAADPTPAQPASSKLTRSAAHRVAEFAWSHYLLEPLPGPRRGHVGRCTGGPRVWRCPAKATGGDTSCRAVVWVWADGDTERLFAEFHRLRCA